MGPQSRPAEFSRLPRCTGGSGEVLAVPPAPRFDALGPVHFPRGERHDRLSGRLKPPWKVAASGSYPGAVLQTGVVLAGRVTEELPPRRPRSF